MNEIYTSSQSNKSYTMGYNEEFQILLRRRSAATHAFHLLPLLKPGMRMLDIGCGSGSISIGLADAIAPGEFYGIDIEESQIKMASAAAMAGNHSNTKFQTGNALNLGFEDGFFDVVHAHAVLMHVSDTKGFLSEVKRVLKPGGLISCRDMIGSGCFAYPESKQLDQVFATFNKLLIANGGHPQMGKMHNSIMKQVGFSDVKSSASYESFSTNEDVVFFQGFLRGWFFSEQTIGAIVKVGLATNQQIEVWRTVLDNWNTKQGAFSAIAFGEATGRMPK